LALALASPGGRVANDHPFWEKNLKLTVKIHPLKKLTVKINNIFENDPPSKILAMPTCMQWINYNFSCQTITDNG
jgi:hypothetical protein